MTDVGSKILTSFSLKDIFKYKEMNNVMPPNLAPFCSEYGGDLILREMLIKNTDTIINTFMSGKNPNDIVFKNTLVEHLNKVTTKTYGTCLEMIKKLNYVSKEHFETLAFEIIMRAMTDTIVVKGFELAEGQCTQSELYADIAHEFISLMIKTPSGDVKFVGVLMEMCEKYFDDFTDHSKPLDQNNQYRVDNFKGFMNFIGLLFNRGIISHGIIIKCLGVLKDLIFVESWGAYESENAFDGYIKLVTQILAITEKKTSKRTHIDVEYISQVKIIHSDLKTKNDLKQRLRKFSMLTHRDIDSRLVKMTSILEKKLAKKIATPLE